MRLTERFHLSTRFWVAIAGSQYLSIIRNGLTLMLPIVIAGAIAVLVNNFPIKSYQNLMATIFGEQWHLFGGYIWNGTLAVLSPVMVFTIGHSLAENYNQKNPLDAIHPIIVGLVSFCSLMTIMQPASAAYAIPYEWTGIHGLFLAILVGIASAELFLLLYRLKLLRVHFFSEEASITIANAFAGLIPGVLTLVAFAAFKAGMRLLGVPDIHAFIYSFIYLPFKGLGNTLTTALLYNLVRHLLWFLGIHGSNALEPIMTEIYATAMTANELARSAGEPIPFIFTKTFFDSYISIGGAGSTLSLIVALLATRRRSSMKRIAQISIIPALFNINETLLFGLPIVLNPVLLVPFVLIPLLCTIVAYAAMSWGLVPLTTTEVAWTTPALVSGYVASGGVAGSILQLVNIAVGVVVYIPFVRMLEKVQQYRFEATYKELLRAIGKLGETSAASLVARTDDIGSFSRALANDLMDSIKKNELFLEYQPQVDCLSGKVIGVEALVRWKHDNIGRIPPSLFVVLAEEIGFIQELGMWVCDEACRQLRVWRDKGLADVVMSINVSVKQLADADLPEKIEARLKKHGIDPADFKVEVTESTGLSSDMGHNILLADIRRMGVKIAIDDFGMGHTSLVYLKQFPVSTIKLDGSLVRDITSNKISADIISSISELGRTMGVELLAEFVETDVQAITLKKLGCHIFQGYLYSPPLSADDCEKAILRGYRTY